MINQNAKTDDVIDEQHTKSKTTTKLRPPTKKDNPKQKKKTTKKTTENRDLKNNHKISDMFKKQQESIKSSSITQSNVRKD